MSLLSNISSFFTKANRNILTPEEGYSKSFIPQYSEPVRRKTYEWIDLYMKSPRMDDIHLISRDVAETEYKLYRKEDFRINKWQAKPIDKHPLYDLLDHPNANIQIDNYYLFYLTEVYLQLACGEAFWLMERGNAKQPVELYIIPPHWVSSTPSSKEPFFKVYPLGNISGQTISIDIEDMVWMKEPNPINPYGRGRGRSECVADEMETDEYASKYQKKFFYNDATPPFVVTAPGASESEVIKLKQRWLEKHQGWANARIPAFFPFDAKVIPLSPTPREMDMNESRKFLRDIVSQHHMIPPEIKGIIENSNRATIDSSYYLYAKNVLTPRLKRFQSMMNRQIVPLYDPNLVLMFDNVIPEDEDRKTQRVTIGMSSGTMKVNEARSLLGLEETKDGDCYLRPFNLVPVTPGNGDKPMEDSGTGNKPNPKEEEPKPKEDLGDSDANEAKITQTTIHYHTYTEKDNDSWGTVSDHSKLSTSKRSYWKAMSKEQRLMAWKNFDRISQAIEKEFRLLVREISKEQQAEFMDEFYSLKELQLSATKEISLAKLLNMINNFFAVSRSVALFQRFYPQWVEGMKAGAQIAGSYLGFAPSFDLLNPLFERHLKNYGLDQAKDINDTTKEKLRETLSEGVNQGEDMGQLARRVKDTWSNLGDGRAKVIARTETMSTVNGGQFITYKNEGVKGKEWLSTQDDRTRDAHRDADGQVRPIDDDFDVMDEKLSYPGDPKGSASNVIQCRCTILPVLEWYEVRPEAEKPEEPAFLPIRMKLDNLNLDEKQKKEIEKLFAEYDKYNVSSDHSRNLLDFVTGIIDNNPLIMASYVNDVTGDDYPNIILNSVWFDGDMKPLEEEVRRCAKSGWWIKNGTDWKSIVLHEIGHAIDFYIRNTLGSIGLNADYLSELDAVEESYTNYPVYVKNDISEYATTNRRETRAEAYASYKLGGASKLSNEIGQIMDKYLEKARIARVEREAG